MNLSHLAGNLPNAYSYEDGNDECIVKSIDSFVPVPSMTIAKNVERDIIKSIKRLTNAKSSDFTYMVAAVTKGGKQYIVATAVLNGATIVLRGTDVDTGQVHIPSEIWIMSGTTKDFTEPTLIMSLETKETNVH
jgi:hypothetical protein